MNLTAQRLLVVDDNEDDFVIVRDLLLDLTNGKAQVEWLSTFEAALSALRNGSYDVCLLAYRLGPRTGLELLQELAPENPTPIILLTEIEDHPIDVAAAQAGAVDCLVKQHINAPLLEKTIRYALQHKESEAALLQAQQLAQASAERLKASQTSFRQLFEVATDGILILDGANGQIEGVNPFLCELLECEPGDFVGKPLWEIGTFRDIAADQQAFVVFREQEHVSYNDLPLETRDGRIVWVEFRSNAFQSGDKKVIQCHLRDISERKRAASAEQEWQRFLQSTLDALAPHIAVLDEKGEIIAVNNAWRRFAQENEGTAASCGVGANYIKVCEEVTGSVEEETAAATAVAQGIRQVMAGQQGFGLEYPCHSPTEERWFHLSATRFRGEGPVRVVVTHENITKRKRAEEALLASEDRFFSAFEHAAIGMALVGPGGGWMQVNGALCDLLGYSAQELMGHTFQEITHPDDLDADLEQVRLLLAGKVRSYNMEKRYIHKHGQVLWAMLGVSLIRDGHGHPLYFISQIQDITERKRAEHALEERNREIVTTWESMTDAFFSLDSAWRFTYVNSQAEKLLRSSADELTGKSLWQKFPDVVGSAFERQYKRAIEQNEPVSFEEFFAPHDSWYDIHAYPSSVGLSVYFRDITQRKRAEVLLTQSQQRLALASESAHMGIWDWDVANNELLWDAQMYRLYGLRVEDFGGAYETWQNGLHPEDREKGDADIAAALNGSRDFHTQFRVMWPGGEVRHIEARALVQRDDDGVPVRMIGINWDITQNKQASEMMGRLAAIVESSTDAIVSCLKDGTINSWNDGAQMLYGYPAVEAIGRSVSMLAPPDSPNDAMQLLDKVDRGEPVTNYETVRCDRNGHRINVSLSLSPVKNEMGELIGYAAITRDISERLETESVLRASDERFQSIVTNVPGMVYQFVLRGDGSIEVPFVSEGCRDIYEVEPETLANNPMWAFEKVHPDDRESFNSSIASSAQTLLPWHWEGRHLLESGKIRWVQGDSRPQRLPDGGTLWNGLIMDITARKEAEVERDRFFTMSLDLLGIAGFDGHFKRVNPAFVETLGYSETEFMSRPFLEFVHPEDITATQEVTQRLTGGEAFVGFENRYRHSDGTYRWLEWRAVGVVEEGAIYAAARDVTERKESEAALWRMRYELEVRVEERTAQLARSNATLQGEIIERERAEREVRAQARQHEAVAELGRRALLDIDLDTLLKGAVSLISATLEVDICTFWECVPQSNRIRLRAATGLNEEMLSSLTLPIDANSQVGYTALRNEPIVSTNLAQDRRFQLNDFLVAKGITSIITVPVHDGVLYGVLTACSPHVQKFGQNEVFFLQTVANVLSSALDRKQTEEKIRHLNADLQGVNDELRANEARLLQGNQISTELMRLRVKTGDELREALHQITEAASVMLDVERASVWLFNEEETAIRCLDLFERSAQRHSGDFEMAGKEENFRAIKQQGILAADDVQTHPLTHEFWTTHYQPLGINSVLNVALVVGGKQIGWLCASHVGAPRPWQAEDRTFASAIASMCSLVLESFERARAEVALHEAKEEAERATEEANAANQAKSEFLSRMSHELRTPLNAILGFGQILEMRSDDAKQLANIQQILKAGRHLLNLINEVLDIARIEAGRMSLSLEPIPVGIVVREVLDLVQPLSTNRQIRLNNEVVGDKAKKHVFADQQRLKQVMLNLLSNAVKYNSEGGSVFVSCHVIPNTPVARNGHQFEGHVRFEVRDTGAGLSEQDISRLFVPFERLEAARSQIEGTGIGLTLCKRLVEAMNGQIGVYSEVGTGSTFWVQLPLVSSPLEEATRVEADALVGIAAPVLEGSKTILYIEDNLSNINLIEQALSEQALQVRLLTAMQGSVGLELALQHIPDMILLDVHLPDITGDVVLRHLKEKAATRHIPVVVLSADATPSQVERLMSGGAEAYLTKPLDLKQFFSVLEQVMDKTG